jgi:hypothetical protein
MREYLCMNCENYMKCPVNAGVMCDFVKKAKITYIERLHKNHILVKECNKFRLRESITGEILPLIETSTRFCSMCGKEFIVTKSDRYVCSNPKCKEQSRKFRKSRQRKGA